MIIIIGPAFQSGLIIENGRSISMIRTMLAVASVAAVALGVYAAAAQQDPIAARKALMKDNGDQAKIASGMIKGETQFDLAKVHKIFATFEEAAAKAPALFQKELVDQPTADDPYTASPEIWKNMKDFKARLAKLGSNAKAADSSVKDLDSFKAAFGNIGKNDCSSCHEKYRLKKS
jgi:cytochrome c556